MKKKPPETDPLGLDPLGDPLRLPGALRKRRVRPVRLLLLLGVFMAAAVLFSRHFESRFGGLAPSPAVRDEIGALGAASSVLVDDLARRFRDDFGLVLRVRIGKTPGIALSPDSKTVLVDVAAPDKSVRLVVPPLYERALGEATLKGVAAAIRAGLDDAGELDAALPAGLQSLYIALAKANAKP